MFKIKAGILTIVGRICKKVHDSFVHSIWRVLRKPKNRQLYINYLTQLLFLFKNIQYVQILQPLYIKFKKYINRYVNNIVDTKSVPSLILGQKLDA